MTSVPFLARLERLPSVGSTNDVVRAWLAAGTPEVCLAVADEQTAGRGRDGRAWTAPPGAGLLLSVGFRPTWLEPDRAWRLAALVALAMAEAAEVVVGLRERSIRLKWPNDLVIETWPGGGDRSGRRDDLEPGPSPALSPAQQTDVGGGSASPLESGPRLALFPAQQTDLSDRSGGRADLGPDPALFPAQQTDLSDRSGGRAEAVYTRSVAGWATNPVRGEGGELPVTDLLPPTQRPVRGEPNDGDDTDLLPPTQQTPGDPSRDTETGVLKLAGVLGETIGLGTDDPRVIVGIGVNADWPATDFPPELAPSMTSLREQAGGRPFDTNALLDAFVERLETRTVALRAGRFDAPAWVARQLTNGRPVRLDALDGGSTVVRALGVDVNSGGLIVADPAASGGQRSVLTGEIVHLRLADDLVDGRPVRV